jgi:hypothetical protein
LFQCELVRGVHVQTQPTPHKQVQSTPDSQTKTTVSTPTCSKLLKGTVTAGGSLIQSGSLPRRLARFLDLAPTTPSLKSLMGTTHLPHQLGMVMLRVRPRP